VLTKIANPVAIFAALAVGLIVMAVSGRNRMAEDTQSLVESEHRVRNERARGSSQRAGGQPRSLCCCAPGCGWINPLAR
jgi:hypothetical protein